MLDQADRRTNPPMASGVEVVHEVEAQIELHPQGVSLSHDIGALELILNGVRT